jgi:hypothetical protein
MAVETIWPIDPTCGHHADRDLSDRPADRRAGFAEWLARQECTDCWRSSNEGNEQDKAAWLVEARRGADCVRSMVRAVPDASPGGTERAVPWDVRCRHHILSNAYTALVTEGTTSEAEWAEIEESARTVARAFSVRFSLSK